MLITLCCLFIPTTVVAKSPTAEEMRKVVQQSVPFLEREGVAWIKERKCVSCHQIPFMIWGMESARRAGILKETVTLKKWRAWSLEQTLAEWGTKKRKGFAHKNADTIAQLMLARGYASGSEKDYQRLKTLLLEGQQKDGSWFAGGQLPLQKRPKQETTEVSTMWNLLALNSMMGNLQQDPEIQQARNKAITFLKTSSHVTKSTEWLATRLLFNLAILDKSNAEKMKQQLLKDQNKDGGWGWLREEASDALATGQVLYALSRAGVSSSHVSIQRVWHFLKSTQQKDGSWKVNSTKEKRKDRPIHTSIYWGTAWSVIGIAQTLSN